MPQDDNEANELDHAEEIALVIFQAAEQSAEIVEPGKEALDFAGPTVATQFAIVLGALLTAVVLWGCDEPDTVFFAGGPDRADRFRRRGRRSFVLVWLA